jgi:phosphate transport system protein
VLAIGTAVAAGLLLVVAMWSGAGWGWPDDLQMTGHMASTSSGTADAPVAEASTIEVVATDLRFVAAVLKINNDLERIGDLAVNIAERAQVLNRKVHESMPVDLAQMSTAVERMLHDSIDALVNLDARGATTVCKSDDAIDKMKHDIDRVIKQHMVEETDKDAIDVLVALLRVSRDLERVADHATNIAEDLIYMTDGRIIRHHAEEYETDQASS